MEGGGHTVKLVGKYYLTKTIGEGAFGKVKLGVHSETQQKVAVKIMKKSQLLEARLVDQVKREIAILKLVNHRHVVKLHEVMSSPEKLYMVLELVTGGELFWRLVMEGRFTEETARKYFQQLIKGVEYCHSLGIYHRDLKPENLLLDASGGLKITDFGLSAYTGGSKPNEDEQERMEVARKKQEDLEQAASSEERKKKKPSLLKLSRKKKSHTNHLQVDAATSPGKKMLQTKCGTAHYAAPEVLRSRGYDGGPADIWSCGIILFVLLAGDLPFEADLDSELHEKICNLEYTFPPHFSPLVKSLLRRFLVTDPEKRITIAELKQNSWFKVDFCEDEDERPDISNIDLASTETIQTLPDEPPDLKITNAFQLINVLGALDMTRMLRKGKEGKGTSSFSSDHPPQEIVKKLSSLLDKMPVGYQVQEMEYRIMVTGKCSSGMLSYVIDISKVTEELCLVDFKKTRPFALLLPLLARMADAGQGAMLDFWQEFSKVSDACQDIIFAAPPATPTREA